MFLTLLFPENAPMNRFSGGSTCSTSFTFIGGPPRDRGRSTPSTWRGKSCMVSKCRVQFPKNKIVLWSNSILHRKLLSMSLTIVSYNHTHVENRKRQLSLSFTIVCLFSHEVSYGDAHGAPQLQVSRPRVGHRADRRDRRLRRPLWDRPLRRVRQQLDQGVQAASKHPNGIIGISSVIY